MKYAWLIPNALTFSRVLLCPAIVYCQIHGQARWAMGLFALAGFSDFLDGYVARRFRLETEFGALFDPACDKVLILAFFTFLMTQGSCPPWFLGLLLAIVLLQSLGFLLVHFSRGRNRPPLRPLGFGKWNLAMQFTWIGVLFADLLLRQAFPRNFQYSALFHLAGYAALSVLQVSVFFRYFYGYRRYFLPDPRLFHREA
jgi:CDP-diacylglycerol--glycerol-3-phosphate 3-phosphatidyltransferase